MSAGENRSRSSSSKSPYGGWIQTYTGRRFWPLDPSAEDVCIEDIAHSLALQCRFTGHVREFYSVAQHSVMVSRLVPQELALWGLLHDASEAYLVDLARPVKYELPEFKAVEERILSVIAERFGLAMPEPKEVKVADNVLLMTERRDLMAIPTHPWDEKHIKPLDEPLRAWNWRDAEQLFLRRFSELVRSPNKG